MKNSLNVKVIVVIKLVITPVTRTMNAKSKTINPSIRELSFDSTSLL